MVPRDAWGEIAPSDLVDRSGVEVVFHVFNKDDTPKIRFVDGTPEAEDLRRFVQAAGVPQPPA